MSTTPVAMAMPRMMKGSSMDTMPMMAKGSCSAHPKVYYRTCKVQLRHKYT